MAIDHVCWQCGLDLARQRPQRDPHYGLPLVQCPRCAWSCVRRRHPVQRGWRAARRIGKAVATLVLQIALLLTMTGLTLGFAQVIRFESSLISDMQTTIRLESALVLAVGAFTLAMGVWLGAMFAFRNIFLTCALWLTWIGGVLAIETVGVRYIYNVLHAWLGSDARWLERPDRWWDIMQAVTTLVAISVIWSPLGRLAAHMYARWRRSRWRAVRRRRRLAR